MKMKNARGKYLVGIGGRKAICYEIDVVCRKSKGNNWKFACSFMSGTDLADGWMSKQEYL